MAWAAALVVSRWRDAGFGISHPRSSSWAQSTWPLGDLLREIGLSRVQHEVVIVAHQAKSQHLGAESIHRLLDDGKHRPCVFPVGEDWFATVTAHVQA